MGLFSHIYVEIAEIFNSVLLSYSRALSAGKRENKGVKRVNERGNGESSIALKLIRLIFHVLFNAFISKRVG
jgi:hypothetical protein